MTKILQYIKVFGFKKSLKIKVYSLSYCLQFNKCIYGPICAYYKKTVDQYLLF